MPAVRDLEKSRHTASFTRGTRINHSVRYTQTIVIIFDRGVLTNVVRITGVHVRQRLLGHL